MDYGMIGKIEKAKRYAEERTRIHVRVVPGDLRRGKQSTYRRVPRRAVEM